MFRRCTLLLLHALLLTGGWCAAQETAEPATTSIQDVIKERQTGKEVRVQGTVTHVEEKNFYVQDATGAIQVSLSDPVQKVERGDVMLVTGELVQQPSMRQIKLLQAVKTGTAPLPVAESLTPQQLADGASRCQRVRVKGSVHDVVTDNGQVWLHLQSVTVPVTVLWRPKLLPGQELQRPDDLLDALVEITGVAVPPGAGWFWSQLLPESAADIDVLKPGSPDVFTRPLRTLRQLREIPASPYGERFRVIATVTYASDAGWYYLQDDTDTARGGKGYFLPAQTNRRVLQANPPLKRGQQVELVGFVNHRDKEGRFMPWLVQCEWRVLGNATTPPSDRVDPSQLMADHRYDGRSVTITGRVRATSIYKDKDEFFVHLITLEEDGIQFYALVQKGAPERIPVSIDDYVRMDGVVLLNQSDDAVTEWFRINLWDLNQLAVTTEPWRLRHVVKWLLGGVALVLGALVWILALRRQVRLQTAKLVEANIELARFKQVVETTTDLVAMASLNHEALYFNSKGRDMLGYDEKVAASDVPFDKIYTPETLELFEREGFPRAFEHGHWEAEVTMVHKSGRLIPVSFVGLVLRDANGAPICLSCIARDMTTRLKLEQHLRDSNDELLRFKTMADTTSDLVAMADLEGHTVYLNIAGRKLLGIGPDESLTAVTWTDVYTPETMALFESEEVRQSMITGVWTGEVSMRHRDGTVIPVSFVGLILRTPEGQPLCMSCIARDVSERNKLDRQLRQSLEHERELNELKSSFVNTISHEFRTPLGIILFAASMLRRFDARYGPDERAQQLSTIEEAVGRLNALVEQSLNLGRAESAEPQAENVELAGLCHRIVDEVQSSTSLRSPIGLEITGVPGRVRSDTNLLRAILSNLLGNAVKYSSPGSPVVLKVEARDSLLVFTVRDHGPGLRPEDLPNLFMTFYRGGNASGIPGTGLGLAIVRRCAEALGGGVTARNAEGGGAEFTVTLPLVSSESASSPS